MTDLTPEQRAEIDYLHTFNPDRGSRWIAAQLGDSVSYSTILRYLAEQRHNGHPAAESSELAAVVVAADDQPAEEAPLHQAAEPSSVAVAAAPSQAEPWLEWQRTSPEEQLQIDIQRIRAVVAGCEGIAVGALRDVFTGGDTSRPLRERFDAAFSRLQADGAVLQSANGVMLTSRGRWLVEEERARAAPAQEEPAPDFAQLRRVYEDSLPARRQMLLVQAQAMREERLNREQIEQQALSRFVPHGALWSGWRVASERDPTARNLLAFYPPTYPDLPDRGVYVRVRVDHDQDVLWLQSSRGGPTVYLRRQSSHGEVQAAIAQVYVPAVAGDTVPALPTLDDVQEDRS
jgi:hypothetical protein